MELTHQLIADLLLPRCDLLALARLCRTSRTFADWCAPHVARIREALFTALPTTRVAFASSTTLYGGTAPLVYARPACGLNAIGIVGRATLASAVRQLVGVMNQNSAAVVAAADVADAFALITEVQRASVDVRFLPTCQQLEMPPGAEDVIDDGGRRDLCIVGATLRPEVERHFRLVDDDEDAGTTRWRRLLHALNDATRDMLWSELVVAEARFELGHAYSRMLMRIWGGVDAPFAAFIGALLLHRLADDRRLLRL